MQQELQLNAVYELKASLAKKELRNGAFRGYFDGFERCLGVLGGSQRVFLGV